MIRIWTRTQRSAGQSPSEDDGQWRHPRGDWDGECDGNEGHDVRARHLHDIREVGGGGVSGATGQEGLGAACGEGVEGEEAETSRGGEKRSWKVTLCNHADDAKGGKKMQRNARNSSVLV